MTLKDVLDSLTPIFQGAEAKTYRYHIYGPSHPPVLLKYRFPKGYRHPNLDNVLTKGRITGEARMILKCLRSHVRVPELRFLDVECGVLGLEWIDGSTVKNLLVGDGGRGEGDGEEESKTLSDYGWAVDDLMNDIGVQLATMHMSDIIHGDLTTSNMMVRRSPSSPNQTELLLIDFGLSYVSNLIEDKAVDLYVLEKAFISTHPDSEAMFSKMLEAYGTHSGKAWSFILKRLEQGDDIVLASRHLSDQHALQVRLRGRKRSMVG